MEENKGVYEQDVKMKSPMLERLENFWYYHKWHTIIAVFLVVAIVVMSLQFCQKTSFDAHIIYAGNYEISRVADNGDTSPYNNMLSELKLVVGDVDGDGEVNIDLRNLFVVNDEEADELVGDKDGYEINMALVKEDAESLYQFMLMSDYYVCFLSERLYLEYSEKYDGIFTPLAPYTADGVSYEYAGDSGIYLRSLTDFSTLPEFSKLPSDTVVCLRSLSEMSKSRYQKTFEESEVIIKNILSFEK
ncbi:MAG: hypothetical protein IJW66_06335 [Clostridia bacterium]|nr:hypothetical protein [Clostridia bacterium]